MSTHKELAGRLRTLAADFSEPDTNDGADYRPDPRAADLLAAASALDSLSPPDGVGLTRYSWAFSAPVEMAHGAWVRYDDAAAALAAEKARADEAEARVEELETDAGRVSAEFEGDLWKAIRRVVERNPGFNWRDYEPDGMTADDVATLFDEDMQEAWAQSERAVKRAEAAEARCDTLAGELSEIRSLTQDNEQSERSALNLIYEIASDALATIPAKPETKP